MQSPPDLETAHSLELRREIGERLRLILTLPDETELPDRLKALLNRLKAQDEGMTWVDASPPIVPAGQASEVSDAPSKRRR